MSKSKCPVLGSSTTQKTLLSFFTKRSSSDTAEKKNASDTQAPENDVKRLKLELEGSENVNCDQECGNENIGTLSPQQKKMIHEKSIKAKIKRCKSICPVIDENMGPSWFQALESEFSKSYFKEISSFVTQARAKSTIYPPPDKVWEWTKHCAVEDIKVVILGQDPYHGPNQAHGLCFSVPKGVRPPPSLLNMYKELSTDIPGFVTPDHGYLVGWAKQGVLLLNAVLTVEAHKPNSHKDRGWEKLTDAVINWISKNLDSVVFLLWGAYAQKKAAMVNKQKHFLLQCTHPSPLSAHRGFLGCKHFSKCNELLEKKGRKPIDWSNLP